MSHPETVYGKGPESVYGSSQSTGSREMKSARSRKGALKSEELGKTYEKHRNKVGCHFLLGYISIHVLSLHCAKKQASHKEGTLMTTLFYKDNAKGRDPITIYCSHAQFLSRKGTLCWQAISGQYLAGKLNASQHQGFCEI